LASHYSSSIQFIGVEPAENLRKLAIARTEHRDNVRVLDGRFESLPLDSDLAFHWTTDVSRSVAELVRVLRPTGEMDLTFIGRNNGREFIQKTTPVFFKYLTPAMIVETVSLRKQLTLEAAAGLFRDAFGSEAVAVNESYRTYYDTLDGHWAWWLRIEGQFINMPQEKKAECDQAVRAAISDLQTPRGIPYTVHLLHVSLRRL
jgi:hypothetical protein